MNSSIDHDLAAALRGHDLPVGVVARLLQANGGALQAVVATADALRREQAGDTVTYVVNRNLNFTNVCEKRCKFCAYARGFRSEQGYWIDRAELVRRAREAVEFGATEVCIQAGLAPDATPDTYLSLLRALREALPALHIHAFSPEEIKFGARLSGLSIARWLAELKAAGLDTMPGTSAEILDDSVRRVIAPGRISTGEWLDVIRTAHGLGIPTTSTMMFGHVETAFHQAAHLILLRDLQRETGGITEFVPLGFVHEEAPLFLRDAGQKVQAGASEDARIAVHAVARIVLGRDIPNLQASWVKEGPERAVRLLGAGVNDLGGTLINESISTSAGAAFGQRLSPGVLRQLAYAAGRPAAERNTRYALLKSFAVGTFARDPLDDVPVDDPRFGSYDALVADPAWRYEPKPRASRDRSTPA